MRAAVLALVVAAGCKIADVHFIGPGDDATMGSDGTVIDGPPAASTHAILVDPTAGLFVLGKSAAGALSATTTMYPTAAVSVVLGPGGTHTLYAILPTAVRTFTIAQDGTLAMMGSDVSLGQCSGQYGAISPDGKMLAVGCSNPRIETITIDPTSGLLDGATVMTHTVNQSISPRRPAFTADGRCLFIADDASGQFNVFTFQIMNTTLQSQPSMSGPPKVRGIVADPTNTYLYLAGQSTVMAMSISPQNCALATASTQGGIVQPEDVVLDLGRHVAYVAGDAVAVYSGLTISQIPGSPFIPQAFVIADATMDPALPILYLTAPGFSGVMAANVDSNGAVTSGPITSVPTGPSPTQLVLIP